MILQFFYWIVGHISQPAHAVSLGLGVQEFLSANPSVKETLEGRYRFERVFWHEAVEKG